MEVKRDHSDLISNMTFIFLICSLVLTFVLCYFSENWSDDYVFILNIKEKKIFGHLYDFYLNIDGRFLSVGTFIQSLVLFLPPQFGSIIWLLFFYFSCYFLFKIVLHEIPLRSGYKSRDERFLILIFLLFFFFSNHLNISDTVYWLVGGGYSLCRFMSLMWIYIILKKIKNMNALFFSCFLVFTFSVGRLGANFSACLLTFLILTFYFKKIRFYKIFLLFSFLTAGTLVTILAPGNFKRAAESSNSFNFSLSEFLYNFMEIPLRYCYYSVLLIILMLLFSLILFKLKNENRIIPKLFFTNILKYFFSFTSFENFIQKFKWLLISLSSVIPILAVPDFSGRRTAIPFMIFVAIFLVTSFYKIFTISSFGKGSRKAVHFLLFVITFAFVLILSNNFLISNKIKNQIKDRNLYLKQFKGELLNVTVKPILVQKIPFTYKFHDYFKPPYSAFKGYQSICLDSSFFEAGIPYYYLTPP